MSVEYTLELYGKQLVNKSSTTGLDLTIGNCKSLRGILPLSVQKSLRSAPIPDLDPEPLDLRLGHILLRILLNVDATF